MALWSDPYYPFPAVVNKLTGKPIVVDVTRSVQNFPNEQAGIADVISEFRDRNLTSICELGAGKLRNAIYLLKEGFAVCAVEHAQVFERPQGKERLARAKRFKQFTICPPALFGTSATEYDAILLINVINVVPNIDDRKQMIRRCADHLRKAGLLLWMSQYREPLYRRGATNRMRICDGYCYNLGKEYQTFVKEFTMSEIRAMFPRSRFREVRELNVRFHNALVFERR